jgi:hypothetical protein
VNERAPRRPPNEEELATLSAAAAGEPVVDHAIGLGATLVLTRTRVVVVRQGAHFRPRSGIRSWPLASIREMQLVSPRHGNGRVVIRIGPYPWQAVSVFIGARDWPDAERIVGRVRRAAALDRRSASR